MTKKRLKHTLGNHAGLSTPLHWLYIRVLLQLISLIQDLELIRFPIGKIEFQTFTYHRNDIIIIIIIIIIILLLFIDGTKDCHARKRIR